MVESAVIDIWVTINTENQTLFFHWNLVVLLDGWKHSDNTLAIQLTNDVVCPVGTLLSDELVGGLSDEMKNNHINVVYAVSQSHEVLFYINNHLSYQEQCRITDGT